MLLLSNTQTYFKAIGLQLRMVSKEEEEAATREERGRGRGALS